MITILEGVKIAFPSQTIYLNKNLGLNTGTDKTPEFIQGNSQEMGE